MDRAISIVENHRTVVVAGFSVFLLFVCALFSATRLMWYDELGTYYPAKLSFHNLLAFFNRALDVHTPVASIVLYGTMKLLGDNAVVDRLPFALGFLVMCLAIYRFVARRLPVEYAIAAMIFPAASEVFHYATEIREYGLEIGLAGIALVCWQDASEGRHRAIAVPGLFLSLAAALSCHYYAAFLWIPFGLAELTRTWQRRRVDVPVLLALVLSPAVLLLFVPAIRLAHQVYTPDVFARPTWGHIVNAYFTMLTHVMIPIFASAVIYFLATRGYSRPVEDLRRPPLAERVLAISLALVPAIAVPICFLLGSYVYRYTLYTIAGIAIFLAFEMAWALKGDRAAALLVSVVLLGWFGIKGAAEIHEQMAGNGGIRTPLAQPINDSPWMKALEGSSLPVVATPAVFYLQLQHYAPDPVRPRIVYAADHALALKIENSDTGETNMLRFATMLPIRVEEFDRFLEEHPHFLLVVETATASAWHIPALIERGAAMRLVNRTQDHWVFDVTMPAK